MRTIPHINDQLKQLDEIVRTEFITEISGENCCRFLLNWEELMASQFSQKQQIENIRF